MSSLASRRTPPAHHLPHPGNEEHTASSDPAAGVTAECNYMADGYARTHAQEPNKRHSHSEDISAYHAIVLTRPMLLNLSN